MHDFASRFGHPMIGDLNAVVVHFFSWTRSHSLSITAFSLTLLSKCDQYNCIANQLTFALKRRQVGKVSIERNRLLRIWSIGANSHRFYWFVAVDLHFKTKSTGHKTP
jgi:hypothetical protein